MLEVLTAIREIVLMVCGILGLGVMIRKEIRESRERRKSIEKDPDPDE